MVQEDHLEILELMVQLDLLEAQASQVMLAKRENLD